MSITVGVRFCGGCNPRYHRVAVARRIADRFPQIKFTTAQGGIPYDAVLLICGCTAACAEQGDLCSRTGIIPVRSEKEEATAVLRLQNIVLQEAPNGLEKTL